MRLIFQRVASEINSLRLENNLPKMQIYATMPLDELGFDSLTYTVLLTRLETKLTRRIWEKIDKSAPPSIVADLIDLFEPLQTCVSKSRAAKPE